MRITEIDLQYEDIIWFGIDKNDYIFECTSAGCGNVPSFVCDSKERTKLLEDYFLSGLRNNEKDSLKNLSEALSNKGIFCYDIYNENEKMYSKISVPKIPLGYKDLPNNIKEIIKNNRIDIDVLTDNIINVKHAY